jgi:hypothetical protein
MSIPGTDAAFYEFNSGRYTCMSLPKARSLNTPALRILISLIQSVVKTLHLCKHFNERLPLCPVFNIEYQAIEAFGGEEGVRSIVQLPPGQLFVT